MEEKVEEIRDKMDAGYDSRKVLSAVAVSAVVVVAGFLALQGLPSESGDEPQQQLTDYQRAYVDCPDQYLPLCTQMSKLPTEPVKFQKVQDGKLYLELPRSDRTLIARIKDGGNSGYLIRIQD